LGALGRGSTESLPIVFILEEFEVFTQQPRQTLLYNLFDTAQSSKNPVLVVGLATQLDVMELLEKRVKSRFNHRFLYILPSPSLEDFVEKGASIGRGEGEAHKAYLKVRFEATTQ
jgi:origin recognition complex subunit 4